MKTLLIALSALPLLVWAQPQAENHIPYIETNAKADYLVVPDEIYLGIQLREQDERTKVSVEQLEKRMFEALRQLDIDIEKQLKLADLSSNIKTYFLRRKDIKKSKRFELKLHDATTAGRVLAALEEKGISNVHLSKTDYSKLEELKLHLLSKAVAKPKNVLTRWQSRWDSKLLRLFLFPIHIQVLWVIGVILWTKWSCSLWQRLMQHLSPTYSLNRKKFKLVCKYALG